ncbi:MAG: hypothetical protein WCS01_14310, partial [bacterium]
MGNQAGGCFHTAAAGGQRRVRDAIAIAVGERGVEAKDGELVTVPQEVAITVEAGRARATQGDFVTVGERVGI